MPSPRAAIVCRLVLWQVMEVTGYNSSSVLAADLTEGNDKTLKLLVLANVSMLKKKNSTFRVKILL